MLSVNETTTRKCASNNLLEYAEENWTEGCFNDVTIKLENEETEVSRMVLASRSLYLKRCSKQK